MTYNLYLVSKKNVLPNHNKLSGFTLLESLISISIFSIFIVFFITSFRQIFAAQDISWQKIEASFYAQEGMEVTYNLFHNASNWQTYANSFFPFQSYQISNGPGNALVAGTKVSGDYTQEIYINPVYRDAQLKIVGASEPGATLDPQIVQVQSRVSWESRGKHQQVEFETYLTQSVPEKIF